MMRHVVAAVCLSSACALLGGCVVQPAPAPAARTAPPPGAAPGAAPAGDPGAAPPAAAGGGLAQTGPIECHGSESRVVENASITAGAGPAVNAHGGCSIVIRNCELIGEIGIDAHGGAVITLENSTVQGTSGKAVDLHGGAVLNA